MPLRRPVDSIRRLLILAADTGSFSPLQSHLTGANGGLTETDAEKIAQAILRDTTEKAARRFVPADVWLAVNGSPAAVPDGVRGGLLTIGQDGSSESERWTHLFARGFADGYDHILLQIGAVPHLPPAFLIDAWGRLRNEKTDVVIGPTDSGGLYLLGLKENRANLFQSRRSEAGFLETLRESAQTAALPIAQTPIWYTVETRADLRRLHTDLERGVAVAPHTQAALSPLYLV